MLAPIPPNLRGGPGIPAFDVVMNDNTVNLYNHNHRYGDTTPMLSFTRRLKESERLQRGMIYFLASTGYLTGGVNTHINDPSLAPFRSFLPETVTNYELGFKGSLADGRLQLNSSLFYMDYRDKQLSLADLGLDTTTLIKNAANLDIYGLEIESTARPWAGGVVKFDLGYLINDYRSVFDLGQSLAVDPSALSVQDLTPNWTANVSVQHTFALRNGVMVTPMFGMYRQSAYDWVGNRSFSGPGSPCYDDGYTKYRLRVAYAPPSQKFELALLGRNITDERIIDHCSTTLRDTIGRLRLEAPRSWGLEFTSRWGS
jgi:iron complex outermembrane receptor protein